MLTYSEVIERIKNDRQLVTRISHLLLFKSPEEPLTDYEIDSQSRRIVELLERLSNVYSGKVFDSDNIELYAMAMVMIADIFQANDDMQTAMDETLQEFKDKTGKIVTTYQVMQSMLQIVKTVSPNENIIDIFGESGPAISSSIDYHVIANNKLPTKMQDGSFSDADIKVLNVGKRHKGSMSDVTANVKVSYYDAGKVTFLSRDKFTEYDRQVLDTVTSLYLNGDKHHVITPATVYRAMTNVSHTPAEDAIKQITESIDKLRNIDVSIDLNEEMKARGKKGDNFKITGKVINADVASYTIGGNTVASYVITREPILYSYAHKVNQVLNIPSEAYAIHEITAGKPNDNIIPSTRNRVAIKGYLLRRIYSMKGNKAGNLNHVISLSSVIKSAGLLNKLDDEYDKKGSAKDLNYTKKVDKIIYNNKDFIYQCMDYWKATGIIKDYSNQKDGRKVTGIKVFF